jgi:predicted enzyme related to lactoylglutathione lyase
VELPCNRGSKNKWDFYSKLFGWEKVEVNAGPFGTYTIFKLNDEDIAGMMNPTIDYTRKLGARWYAFIAVDDIDISVARAKELGATVITGPDDVPGVGRTCLLSDPIGALIPLMQAINNSQEKL